MSFSPERGFVVRPYRAARQGRFAYLLDFLCGLKYKGYQGYEAVSYTHLDVYKRQAWSIGVPNGVIM